MKKHPNGALKFSIGMIYNHISFRLYRYEVLLHPYIEIDENGKKWICFKEQYKTLFHKGFSISPKLLKFANKLLSKIKESTKSRSHS